MSFILEALKKSEQQRQQKNGLQQKVRKRTLSQEPRQQGRWPYWVVTGGLALILSCSWWFFGEQELSTEQSHVPAPPAQVNPPQNPKAAETKSPAAFTSQQPDPVIDTAPVPRDVGLTSQTSVEAPKVHDKPSTTKPQLDEGTSSERVPAASKGITTVIIEPAESQATATAYIESAPAELPLYLDLSRELRERMPRLTMSMHYYIADPARRMVRINNLLLHEGDWVSEDLQVVEITPAGVTLDFLGKLFAMRSTSR